MCRTGGQEQLDELAEKLRNQGVTVTGTTLIHATCHELDVQRELRKHKEAVAGADAVVVLACGAGVQSVGDSTEKPVVSGCDSLFIGNSRRQMHFYEKCSVCGECVLNETAGLCPETRCPKGLLNGPCGGATRGKCEVDAANNCIWIGIYDRMKKLGRTEDMMRVSEPKNRKVANKPHRIEEPLQPKKQG